MKCAVIYGAAIYGAAGLALIGSGCIDTRLSLGQHNAPAVLAPDASEPDDAKVAMHPPHMMGGVGGMSSAGTGGMAGTGGDAAAMPPTDASTPPLDADASADSPCDGATFAAQLECQVDDNFFGQPVGGPSTQMTTTAVLTVVPDPNRPQTGRATGTLAFAAWNASFMGRIEGQLDCERGTFRALIFDGMVEMPASPPGPFFGQVDGLLDPLTDAISGAWWHGPNTQGDPRCAGSWTASRD